MLYETRQERREQRRIARQAAMPVKGLRYVRTVQQVLGKQVQDAALKQARLRESQNRHRAASMFERQQRGVKLS